jgi:hypothetical protein
MPKDRNLDNSPELGDLPGPEALRLLWEGTRKALQEWGMDRGDLVSLCDVMVRLADHRLLVLEAAGSPAGSHQVADQVRHYRQLASDLLRRASTPPPEPDWAKVDEKLRSGGAAPLEFPVISKE